MPTLRAPSHLLLALARLLAVMAVVGLALLPNGVMAQKGKDGTIELVLCSGDGPVTVLLDPVTGESTRKAPETSAKPGCDWAMVHGQTDFAPATQIPAPPQSLDRRAAPIMATALWRPAHDPRGLYARGPPSLI